jgi:glycine/D-amino acid oxidase-like deaminating enzyme
VKIVVIGNGSIALMTAWETIKRIPDAEITLLAPHARPGSASIAAAAMFNSFAEIEVGTLENEFEKAKWLFNNNATPYWKKTLPELEDESGLKIHHGFGTFLINNHVSDSLEDQNFEAIHSALKEFNEPHQLLNPEEIPNYKPEIKGRASRCIYIPNEGYCNPIDLIKALEKVIVKSGRANLIDDYCTSIKTNSLGTITTAVGSNGQQYSGDIFLLAPGANFSKIVQGSNLNLEFPRIFYGAGCTALLKTGSNTIENCIRTPNRGLACGLYTVPRGNNETIIGASNSISPWPVKNPGSGSVYSLLKGAMEQINTVFYKAELKTINMGWRPTSEDTLPMIGGTEISNLYVATGTKRDGLHCSPLIAICLIDSMLGQETAYDLSLFAPDRKPVKIYSRKDAIEKYVRHVMNANYQHDFIPAKNRMLEQMENMYRQDIETLHDRLGAQSWGIPPELVDMYRYGHIS